MTTNTITTPARSAGEPDLVYTVAEAAKKLKTSAWSIYKLIRENELETITIGTRRLVLFASITGYIERRRTGGHHA